MFLSFFGKDDREQTKGLIGFAFVLVVITTVIMLAVQPEFGAKVTSRTLNMDIVSALISLITLFGGYLAGDVGSKK
jgi:hypothetical protein